MRVELGGKCLIYSDACVETLMALGSMILTNSANATLTDLVDRALPQYKQTRWSLYYRICAISFEISRCKGLEILWTPKVYLNTSSLHLRWLYMDLIYCYKKLFGLICIMTCMDISLSRHNTLPIGHNNYGRYTLARSVFFLWTLLLIFSEYH